MKKTIKRILSVIAAAFLGVLCFVQTALLPAAAEETVKVKDFSSMEIEDDLSDLDLSSYVCNPFLEFEVIRFQEYCYSENDFFADYYGLYLYVYNPTDVALDLTKKNLVNMAVSYDSEDNPSYENVPLVFCDKTENNRFYKFKVDCDYLSVAQEYATRDKDGDGISDGKRRYDLVGITLYFTERVYINIFDVDVFEVNSQDLDTNYAKTYYYTGYSSGCAPDGSKESTLQCAVSVLETIKLDVESANYRTGDYVDDVCDDLQTVYFSVPKEYFDDYGGLQKIKAEWYEYKTNPIFVTWDENVKAAFDKIIGVDISSFPTYDYLDWTVFYGAQSSGMYSNYFSNVYNYLGVVYEELRDYQLANDGEELSRLDWLIDKSDVEVEGFYDQYRVSSEELIEYMEWYTERYSDQEKVEGKYAENLFADLIDTDRWQFLTDKGLSNEPKRGHIVQELDATDDTQDLMFEVDKSWWEKIWTGRDYDTTSLSPIVVLDDLNALSTMNESTFASTYYIEKEQAGDVLAYCKKELENGNIPVLFRFAVTDYYCSRAYFEYLGNFALTDWDGYVAQETVFLDFDVISLTFRSDTGTDTVIGVVSDPIDIINGISPPKTNNGSGCNDFDPKKFFGIILLIVLLVLLFPFLGVIGNIVLFVVKIVLFILSLPFKLLGELFDQKKKK